MRLALSLSRGAGETASRTLLGGPGRPGFHSWRFSFSFPRGKIKKKMHKKAKYVNSESVNGQTAWLGLIYGNMYEHSEDRARKRRPWDNKAEKI